MKKSTNVGHRRALQIEENPTWIYVTVVTIVEGDIYGLMCVFMFYTSGYSGTCCTLYIPIIQNWVHIHIRPYKKSGRGVTCYLPQEKTQFLKDDQ